MRTEPSIRILKPGERVFKTERIISFLGDLGSSCISKRIWGLQAPTLTTLWMRHWWYILHFWNLLFLRTGSHWGILELRWTCYCDFRAWLNNSLPLASAMVRDVNSSGISREGLMVQHSPWPFTGYAIGKFIFYY